MLIKERVDEFDQKFQAAQLRAHATLIAEEVMLLLPTFENGVVPD